MIKTINVIYLEQSDTLNDDFFYARHMWAPNLIIG